MDITIKGITVGAIQTNCYVVYLETGETLIVDPGDEADEILEVINSIPEMRLKYILVTHGHFDHILALDRIHSEYPNAKVYAGKYDLGLIEKIDFQAAIWGQRLPQITALIEGIDHKTKLNFGPYKIEVIETPGHTEGGVCYLLDGNLFSGDTLFFRTYGRTDLPDSDWNEMKKSLNKLAKLPEETKVYPGHGIETTIKDEKLNGVLLRV